MAAFRAGSSNLPQRSSWKLFQETPTTQSPDGAWLAAALGSELASGLGVAPPEHAAATIATAATIDHVRNLRIERSIRIRQVRLGPDPRRPITPRELPA
jgi:hypothetical protein